MTTPGLRDFVLEVPTGEESAEDLLPAALAALSQVFTVTQEAGAPGARLKGHCSRRMNSVNTPVAVRVSECVARELLVNIDGNALRQNRRFFFVRGRYSVSHTHHQGSDGQGPAHNPGGTESPVLHAASSHTSPSAVVGNEWRGRRTKSEF